jgi:hypothetical protein
MKTMRKLGMVAGFAAGYVLGAKAGRERYQQITEAAQRLRERPEVKRATEQVSNQAANKLRKVRKPGGTSGTDSRPQQPTVLPDVPPAMPPEPTVVSPLDAAPLPPEPTTPPPDTRTPPPTGR